MKNSTAYHNMISQQLRTGGITQEALLYLYERFPREDFVPDAYKNFAYSDMRIPLDHMQHMLTPLEEALMIQALALTGQEVILEIGTGSGFFTAMLSYYCKHVYSVDFFESFTAEATKKLADHNVKNVSLITDNAVNGWMNKAPYDIIVYTGAVRALTEAQILEILPGGKLLTLISNGLVVTAEIHSLDHNNNWQVRQLFETNTALLIDPNNRPEFVF